MKVCQKDTKSIENFDREPQPFLSTTRVFKLNVPFYAYFTRYIYQTNMIVHNEGT